MPGTNPKTSSVLPAPEQVASYREHGWHVTGQIIPHDLLEEMRIVIDEHQRRPAHARLPPSIGHADWEPGHGRGVRNSEFLSVQQPLMRKLSLLPLLGEIAARLAGARSIRLFDDQAVVKPPDDGEAVTYRAGDSFVMKPGFTGVWRTIETVRKIYVTVG